MKKILLVEPELPIPTKSKNHHNFIPIGLLKIATMHRKNGHEVKLIRGYPNIDEIDSLISYNPNEIWVSSLFTYWSQYVKDTVKYYRGMFPNAKIKVGGIYASLRSVDEVKNFTGCDEVIQGVIPEAEECEPAYDLLDEINDKQIDYQILHTSRGCTRKCAFCGTWIIEPEFLPLKSIKDKIKYKKIVIYDNNFFMNPYVDNILDELIELKKEGKIIWCESQSGFDGRLLVKKPELAIKLKKAGFRYPRIAWDWGYDQWPDIEKQKNVLINAGYNPNDIYIFVLYNWNIPFEEMEKKRIKCFEWKVQIADCRFRPLSQLYDHYKPHIKDQTSVDYYIHEEAGWTDALVKQYRKNIRRQNICIRQHVDLYSKVCEQLILSKEDIQEFKNMKTKKSQINYLNRLGADYWDPSEINWPL